MNLEERIEWAEGALNHGWEITLEIQNGSTVVWLYGPREFVRSMDTSLGLTKSILNACRISHNETP